MRNMRTAGKINGIKDNDWEERVFPAEAEMRKDTFQIVTKESLVNAVKEHAASEKDREICGVLAGTLCRDNKGFFLCIEASIKGDYARNEGANVTFTAETWDHIHREMEARYPGLKIVGWYHSHPGFGIFLSSMDVFIQKNFFSANWQTAYVVDPLNIEDGWFIWEDSKLKKTEAVVLTENSPGNEAEKKDSNHSDECRDYEVFKRQISDMSERLDNMNFQLTSIIIVLLIFIIEFILIVIWMEN